METTLSPQEELYALLLEADLEAYAELALKIKTKAAKIVSLELNLAQTICEEQAELQLARTGRVRQLDLKARQEGISTWVAGRFTRKMHLNSDIQGLVVADLKKRAETLWKIYDRYVSSMPVAIRPGRERTRHLQNLVLSNGSSMQVETAEDIQAGRSMTIQLLHASEVAFWEHPIEAWTALSEAVPMDGSEVFFESTANGLGNLFHQFWEEAEQGILDWDPVFLPWWIHEEYTVTPTERELQEIPVTVDPWERAALEDGIRWEGRSWAVIEALAPRFGGTLGSGAVWDPVRGSWSLTVGQLAWRRRKIADKLGDERAFRQENPAWPEEAFLASGNTFLEEDLLNRLRTGAKAPMARGNMLRVGSGLVFKHTELGDLRIWAEPELEGHYVIGADTASGRDVGGAENIQREHGGTDFSCAQVIRLPKMSRDGTYEPAMHVAELHARMVPEEFAGVIWDLGVYYSCPRPESRTLRIPALIGVERNHSSGETVLKVLDDGRYPELYIHRQPLKTLGRPTRMLGWSTDVTTRQLMLDEVAGALRLLEVVSYSSDLAREWRTFVRNIEDGKPAAQEGVHDDRVMAFAIAWQMIRWHPSHGSAEPEEEFVPGKGPTRM